MSTDVERYARLHAIFDGARRLDAPARDAYLHAQCEDDDELRGEVNALIAAASDDTATSDGFSETRIAASRRALEKMIASKDRPGDEWLPERIAGYQIVGRLGEGGMGVVYEAMQESPRRRVAIKLLHPMQATEERLRRLRHEAEMLGRLHHPGIAQVLEAGTYDLGRGAQPFFAMELVEGVDLRTYCERERLDVRGRLDLLARVCDAVDYAHQKGVIHRDLKPDNILVDEHGQPKVLDFGVARVTDDSTIVQSQVTQDGQLLGTLAYMAPEQLRGESDAITARTDVYGLAVVGFELITEQLPFAVAGLGLATAIQLLQEHDAPQLGTVDRQYRGDVEIIIAHAIEKDPAARYGTAAAFAADIRRYLNDEPIRARPPSRIYRMRKLVRKNRGLFTAVAVVVVSLAIGLGWALVEKGKADRTATERTRQSYRASVVVAADAVSEGRMTSARQFLTDAPEELRDWEWRHLHAQLDQSVRHFDEPAGGLVTDIAVAADGRSFVTAGLDGTLLHRDTVTGTVLQTMQAPGVTFRCAMSSDGRQLVAIGAAVDHLPEFTQTDHRVWVASWSLIDGRQLDAFVLDPSFTVKSTLGYYRVSPPAVRDGFDGSIGHTLPFCAIDVDRRRLIILNRPQLVTLDLDRHVIVASRESLHSLPTLSPSGRYLFLTDRGMPGGENEVTILDATTLETRGRLTGYHDGINSLAVSPDETRMASVTADGGLQIWDLASALASEAVGRLLLTTDTRQGAPSQVIYTEDGTRLISISSGRSIHVWDAVTLEPLVRLPSQEEEITKIQIVPGTDEVVSISGRGRVRFWATERPSPTVLRGHHSFVYAVDVDRELGLLVTGAWDGFEGKSGSVRLWDLQSGDPVAAWGEPPTIVQHAMFLPGHDAFLAAFQSPLNPTDSHYRGRTQVTHIDLATGSSRILHDADAFFTSLHPSRKQRTVRMLIVDETGAHVQLLDLDSTEVTTLGDVSTERPLIASSVSPDERLIAISLNTELRLYRVDDLSVVHELTGHDDSIMSLAFDAQGRRLLSASEDGTIVVWDVQTGQQIARLTGHDDGVLCARFNPTGTRIATGGRDGTLRIWSGESYEQLVALTGHERYIFHLTWQDDGERILTASGDHTVRIWETQPVRDRYRAHRERQALVEKLTPRVAAWLDEHGDAAGLMDTLGDLTPREHQVARQIMLGRVLGTAGP